MARKKTKRAHRKNARPEDIIVANPSDIYAYTRTHLYRFWFGQIGTTFVYVWSDSMDSGFETAVDWLDDNDKAGHFVDVTEADLKEAAEDEGIEWDPSWPDYDDRKFQKVVDAAEADLTQIGHTTLKHGQYLQSDEWGVDDVTDHDEQLDVAEASFAAAPDLLDMDETQEGPDEKNPENGLRVTVENGEVLIMSDSRKREKAIIAAAISAIAYGPNDESLVSYVGED